MTAARPTLSPLSAFRRRNVLPSIGRRHAVMAALLAAAFALQPTLSGVAIAATPASPAKAADAATPALVVPIQTGVWTHALSAYQPPKYPANFTHFEYVNPSAPKGGKLRLANPDRRSSFDKLNPFTIKGVAPAAMEIFVFERLGTFAMDEPKSMYGLLAESMFVAPDLSSISFRIHPLARFSNGDPVLPDDVIDSFNRLKGKLVLPNYGSPLLGVERAVSVDAKTVRFDLKERSIDIIFTLGDMPIFSRKWGAGKPLSEVVTDQPIASGPYTMSSMKMPSRFELQLNPKYWAKDLPVRRGHFNFEQIAYRMYKDRDVTREAFKAGEFDIMRELSARSYARQHTGPKWDSGQIIKSRLGVDTGAMLQAINLNLRLPRFQDVRVREAISLAWDFENYNRLGTFVRANSMFNNTPFAAEGLPSAAELALLEPFRASLPKEVFGTAFRAARNDTHPNALRENLKRAAKLLSEAGWNIAADGKLRNAKGEAFSIEFLEPSSPGRFVEFERNLKILGIEFKERLVDFALFRKRLEVFDYDMIIIVEGKFTLPNPSNLRQSYGSKEADQKASFNYRGVKSPAVDALIERIKAATTMDELTAASRALDRVVMWNHWQIPMLFTRSEPTSYWNKFGIPNVKARFFSVDTLLDVHSLPWPLWTWWDKSLDTQPVAK
ncbi:MAG: ABC transporter substrate-binding protein [Betaproteobacteria bacterium]|nr:MAG: ABC transporter substrate-binding protein [Betaproteobacteria bacterium]